MVPVSSFATLTERAVAPELGRESQQRAVPITAGLTPDLALGDALAEMQAMAEEVLTPKTCVWCPWPRPRHWAKPRPGCL
jgi:HAE1 family hydrophobic/amphiphilic exporter-1